MKAIDEIERIKPAHAGQRWLRIHERGRVKCRDTACPCWASPWVQTTPPCPPLGLFGGVHGLERIGSQVVIHVLESLVKRLSWDAVLQSQLERIRIVAMPVINPGGLLLRRRANPAGVDLMRNAPVNAVQQPTPLVGGHRIGNWLPWYRGKAKPWTGIPGVDRLCPGAHVRITTRHRTRCALRFGSVDRLWYPFARSVGNYPREGLCKQFAQRLMI